MQAHSSSVIITNNIVLTYKQEKLLLTCWISALFASLAQLAVFCISLTEGSWRANSGAFCDGWALAAWEAESTLDLSP